MSHFTQTKAALAAFSLLAAALGSALLAPQAHGQGLNGGPRQLRPPSGSAPVNLAPPATGGQNPQVRTDNHQVPVGVAVVAGELPTTDFGRQLLNTEHQLPVALGVRTVPPSTPAGSSGGLGAGYPGMPHMPDFSGLGKAPDAPPSIRVSGNQASDFVVVPGKCGFVTSGNPVNPRSTFTCTVVFRASVEGARTAVLEAMFPNGDRLQAVLKGTGQPASVAMPVPGGATGTGLQVQMANRPSVGNNMVPEMVDFGSVTQGSRKTVRIATQYPAGSKVLPRLGGSNIQPYGYFTLGEAAITIGGANAGEKAGFTITFAPPVCCGATTAYFEFKDADGRQRKLSLMGTATAQ